MEAPGWPRPATIKNRNAALRSGRVAWRGARTHRQQLQRKDGVRTWATATSRRAPGVSRPARSDRRTTSPTQTPNRRVMPGVGTKAETAAKTDADEAGGAYGPQPVNRAEQERRGGTGPRPFQLVWEQPERYAL